MNTARSGQTRRTWSSRFPLALSLMSLVLMFSLLGAWALRANISGAVMGAGTVEVTQVLPAVQHPDGGERR